MTVTEQANPCDLDHKLVPWRTDGHWRPSPLCELCDGNGWAITKQPTELACITVTRCHCRRGARP